MSHHKKIRKYVALSVVGARPQFVKLQPINRALITHHWKHYIVHSGQHYDRRLSKTFFTELKIPKPDINLGIGSGSHGYQTGRVIERLDTIIDQQRPDVVIVYGDTNATVAGALSAVKLHVPVAHIEAGMRSNNREMPEEINRVITDHIANFHFCVNTEAKNNLMTEGVKKYLHVVGDVMIDVIKQMLPRAKVNIHIHKQLNLVKTKYIIATIHRPSNTDDPGRLRLILTQLNKLNLPVILPAHPRLIERINKFNLRGLVKLGSIKLIPSLGYLDMLALQAHAWTIITDSGGLQKEAYYLRIPCLILRSETEWRGVVSTGWSKLMGKQIEQLPNFIKNIQRPVRHPLLFGNGHAAEKIITLLEKDLHKNNNQRYMKINDCK